VTIAAQSSSKKRITISDSRTMSWMFFTVYSWPVYDYTGCNISLKL